MESEAPKQLSDILPAEKHALVRRRISDLEGELLYQNGYNGSLSPIKEPPSEYAIFFRHGEG
jgi:hypothetical protein